MNTIATRRPLLRRLWARAKATYLRLMIESAEFEIRGYTEDLDRLPARIDLSWGHLEALRVRLALAERES